MPKTSRCMHNGQNENMPNGRKVNILKSVNSTYWIQKCENKDNTQNSKRINYQIQISIHLW